MAAGCEINSDASPQFAALRAEWKRKKYRSIDSDLENAFREIRQDINACQRKDAQRTSAILKKEAPELNLGLYKYRYKDTASGIGASYGWRFYAIHDRDANVLYPIIVYPHRKWADANDDHITECVATIVAVLRNPTSSATGSE